MSVRVFLVEDHAFTRDGLRVSIQATPDLEVVGEAASAEEALAKLPLLRPEVVIMDLGLPGMDGIQGTREIKARFPEVRVVVLTVHALEEQVRAILASGAEAYCLKTGEPESLLLAIRAAAKGSTYLDPPIARMIFQKMPPPPASHLTEREREILRGIAEGRSNKEIAQILGLSPSTVKTHVENLLEKLAASDRTEAAIKALRQGLI
jgi:NarL family two-component system response regulator LiaR